ncbi:MAG TPA: hypothetical protein VHX12_14550, partial [Acidisoma sp.]|nr:hypothetical protein [Acidisoma sp.]
ATQDHARSADGEEGRDQAPSGCIGGGATRSGQAANAGGTSNSSRAAPTGTATARSRAPAGALAGGVFTRDT